MSAIPSRSVHAPAPAPVATLASKPTIPAVPNATSASGKKDPALRLDILVRAADAPVDPEALSIEGEGVSKLVAAVRSWSSALNALLGALTSLPPFIRDMTNLVRDTVTQLLQVVSTRGRQLQAAAQHVVNSVRG